MVTIIIVGVVGIAMSIIGLIASQRPMYRYLGAFLKHWPGRVFIVGTIMFAVALFLILRASQ